jgi:hypothetical protein
VPLSPVVIPANAGIQYAGAYRSITGVSGILDHPLSRMIQRCVGQGAGAPLTVAP